MEPSKEAIAIRITRLNRQITGKVISGSNKLSKKIDRETLLDALTVLYDECNDDPIKKCDELVRSFLDKYRSPLTELRRARVCVSDFEVIQRIGRGHYGEVHMVREKQTGDVYAMKSVRKEQARKRVVGAEDERDILASTSGHWIPRLQYAFQDNTNLYLVMELCNGGDLASLLARQNNPLCERDAAFYVAEVAHALKALHAMGYVHRDVKPQNIFLDRCGHVKLGDFGSCARLSEGSCASMGVGATPDYVAPELLAAADCGSTHSRCLDYCRGVTTAISACDYWSLGVVAFELVTLNRPFSSGDDDSTAKILSNIQKYERDPDAEPPFPPLPSAPSSTWRALVRGLLRVAPARRYNYLDTTQHAALAHLALHAIRHQAPPWVPHLRGVEDPTFLPEPPRVASPPSAAPFRTRAPFAGHLPFVGYSYVAPEENEDTSTGFNASHDCTAIDLATFKSAEKLAVMRGREIASLQSKLAEAEATAGAAAESARRSADADAERQRARLQADITALTLQNKRLERQIEVEKEERMALQRTNQELSTGIIERNNVEVSRAQAQACELRAEREALRAQLARLEARVSELQAECAAAVASADAARTQQQHYKDTIAKERALRRQTLSGGEADGARAAAAEASAAREARARRDAEGRATAAEDARDQLRHDADDLKEQLAQAQASIREKERLLATTSEHVSALEVQLSQERMRTSALAAQVQELERGIGAAAEREAALEEQGARTEARLAQRLQDAEQRAAHAHAEDARRQHKVSTLEQLVRQLEREVSALEKRTCARCAAADAAAATKRQVSHGTNTDEAVDRDNRHDRDDRDNRHDRDERDNRHDREDRHDCGDRHDRHERDDRDDRDYRHERDDRSDTESVADVQMQAHVSLLKEQLERAQAQIQARVEEIAALRQETRTANLARWRKEKEYNDLSLDAKATARDLKRAEERITVISEARRKSDEKASTLQKEIATLKPQYEQVRKDVERYKEQFEKLQKSNEVLQVEVDRSRNDIRKLKSELQYSEKRRLHAEQQEELSARERAQLRDELAPLRAQNDDLMQNNRALQEACSLLEEQLTDLEKLADLHEMKNKDLESETLRLRCELESTKSKLAESERQSSEHAEAAALAERCGGEADEQLRLAHAQLQVMRERLESRVALVGELEARVATLEGEAAAREAALTAAARRLRDLQEEAAAQRTRAQHHHHTALQLQASLADAQEEVAAAREANEAATAWWRTRETKADATLRQQAKLIDFLQAKVEEAGRKKCSLSNKLFGRSGRRAAASPPLLRANRELREEVDRLRARLAAATNGEPMPPTPRREKKDKPNKLLNGRSLSMEAEVNDDSLLIIWADGARERAHAQVADGRLVLGAGMRARLLEPHASGLPHNEANRAFVVKLEDGERGSEAVVVCSSLEERARWLRRLAPGVSGGPSGGPSGVSPSGGGTEIARCDAAPSAALYVGNNAIAIVCEVGLHSLRGPIELEWEVEVSPPRGAAAPASGAGAAAAGGRALLLQGGRLAHAGLLALGSALRRAGSLHPALPVQRVQLAETTAPHLVKGIESASGVCAAVACGRRVLLLRYDAAGAQFAAARALTVDRPPHALLLTDHAVFIAGDKPLRISLPSGALEAFGLDDTTVAAAFKKHSPPRAILLIRKAPAEILLCYTECGVFVDENGRRTRQEDVKWSSAVHGWEFVSPFLYVIGHDRVTIIYVNDETFRAAPCTCDTTSLASSSSECYAPEIFNYKVDEPTLLGTAPNGVIISSKYEDGYKILIIDGKAAFRSIGTSLDSLESINDMKGSSSDLAQSLPDLSPHNESQESVEVTTGFLADIRKRANQLRNKHRQEMSSDDVIKEILTTEVGLKRTSNGRKSPAATSDFDSDSMAESEEGTGSTKCTADVCADMFTRQVRFQQN